MLGAYSLVKVIESELQAYVSATKGRVVRIILLFFSFWVLFPLSEPSFVFGTFYIYIYDLKYHSQPLPQHGLCGHAEVDKH